MFKSIRFELILVIVENNTFIEEFFIHEDTHNGSELSVKVSEVLIYNNYKIKNLRIYLDRLKFTDAVIAGFIGNEVVKPIKKKSLEGLA